MTDEPTLTLTPMQLASISREIDEVAGGDSVREIRIRPAIGTIRLVTLDSGWGTYSFFVYVGGKVVPAGMGQTVEAPEPEGIHDLFGKVMDHPDFAGGTIFTREDVANVIFEPEDGWEDDDGTAPAELLAKVTDEQLGQASDAIDGYIFNGAYSWRDAIRDNVDVEARAAA